MGRHRRGTPVFIDDGVPSNVVRVLSADEVDQARRVARDEYVTMMSAQGHNVQKTLVDRWYGERSDP